MKKLTLIIFFLIAASGFGQRVDQPPYLSISPAVDQSELVNTQIIATLSEVLKTNFSDTTRYNFWVASELEKYDMPYHDIMGMADGKNGDDSYRPTLMEIIGTKNKNERIVKIAYVGHNSETIENQVRCIYNMAAYISADGIRFGLYTDWITRDWQMVKSDNITYFISPSRLPDASAIKRQRKSLKKLEEFFGTGSPEITYYSCKNPKEVFELKGFDYHPMMYVDSVGGFAEKGNRIFSGNNSEYYNHEIIHLFLFKLFPDCDNYFEEGIAMLLGGSGTKDFDWHKKNFKEYAKLNPNFSFSEEAGIYERNFIGETSVPYMEAALLCRRTLRLYGKQALFDLFTFNLDFWGYVAKVGITKANYDSELKKELEF